MYKKDNNDECLICFKKKQLSANLLEFFIMEDILCYECRSKFKINKVIKDYNGLEIESFYEYNDFFKEILIQYKELCDEALAPLFVYPYRRYLCKKYEGYILANVPSRLNKLNNRGFNHVTKMFEGLKMQHVDLFINTSKHDQKQKSSISRRLIDQYIKRTTVNLARDSKILLIDDVLTTGSSIDACYQLIKKEYSEIKGVVLAIMPIKEREKNNDW
ncbi:MAG: phosphoribosyltransferase family protein [Erysipelotrichaceae bacterium]|nr:phosphoribosyltransferase family protein [Erysipelotrichaceae bacterium]MDD4642826.1 phosphoribosyltransferase family protein [Erysipelotrichaceae bacterium]